MLGGKMNERELRRALAMLLRERPEWLPVLEAALVVAERSVPYGGEFAGSWVLDELEEKAGHRMWFANLRLLARYGFLEKAGESTRGGRRAYYRCPDLKAIRRALEQFRLPSQSAKRVPPTASSHRLSFIGAGASGKPGSDVGRQAGEITYVPESWR